MGRLSDSSRIDTSNLFLRWDETLRPPTPDDPPDFIYEVHGEIRVLDEVEHYHDAIGRFGLGYIDFDLAEKASIWVFDLFDAHQYTCELYEAVCETDTEVRPDLRTLLRIGDRRIGNILILKRIELLPEFRGKGIGLLVMQSLINRFSLGAFLIAIKVFPLQFEFRDPRNHDDWPSKLGLDSLDPDEQRATAKLRKHYARLGFRALPGTPFMFVAPKRRLPTLRQLARAGASSNRKS